MKNSLGIYSPRVYRMCGVATLALLGMHLLLVLVSWLVTAAAPHLAFHSLLSSEGVRWYVGHFASNLLTPALVWLILVSISGGVLVRAVSDYLRMPSHKAVRVVAAEVALFVVIGLLLTVVPHAMLLSVTGNLFPSSFSDGLMALLCLMVTVCSLTYCAVSRQEYTIAAAYETLCYGAQLLTVAAPLYVVAAQLFYSVLFVVGY